jgi:trk system potassium uptake protein TrkA
LKKQFVVIGCGRFGSSVAMKLSELGEEVMVVDRSEEIIQSISESVTYAVQADATDEQTIRSLGIRNFDVAVVTIGSDIQSSILITLMCKEMGVKYVVSKAQNELHAKVLYKTGADRVVFPEREMGVKIAKSLVSDNILDYIELAPDYSIIEIVAADKWIGKNLRQLNFRARYGVNVMAVKHGLDIQVAVGPEETIREGDVLVVIGHNDDLNRIDKA